MNYTALVTMVATAGLAYVTHADTLVAPASQRDTVFAEHPFDDPHDKAIVNIRFEKGDSAGMVITRETADTVYIYKKITESDVARGFKAKLGQLRERGIGGSGGPTYGVMALYTKPIYDYVRYQSVLKKYPFAISENFEPVVMGGGFGYGGLGNGVRLGGIGMDGSKTFTSDQVGDSSAALRVRVNTGGFLMEKCIVDKSMNYIVGGYIGGGSLKLQQSVSSANTQTVFDSDAPSSQSTTIKFTSLEFHGEATYTAWTLFHIGGGVSLPIFIATDGFSYANGNFISLNPVLNVRIVFGLLG